MSEFDGLRKQNTIEDQIKRPSMHFTDRRIKIMYFCTVNFNSRVHLWFTAGFKAYYPTERTEYAMVKVARSDCSIQVYIIIITRCCMNVSSAVSSFLMKNSAIQKLSIIIFIITCIIIRWAVPIRVTVTLPICNGLCWKRRRGRRITSAWSWGFSTRRSRLRTSTTRWSSSPTAWRLPPPAHR